MKTILWLLILLAFTAVSQASDFLMRDFGSFNFSGEGYAVRVDLVQIGEDGLLPTITFLGHGRKGSVGTGKHTPIPFKANRWAVEFYPPHELWIYNGKDEVKLYERTAKGFKGSSSGVRPELFLRAPEGLKKVIAEDGKTADVKQD